MLTLPEHLKATGETQTAFAKRGGWRIATVSNWCRGVTTPGLNDAARVEEMTGGAVPIRSWLTMPDALGPNHCADALARGAAS